MIEGAITQRWARALIALAQEENQLAAVREQLNAFQVTLTAEDGKLAEALQSPSFSRADKVAIVTQLAGALNALPAVRNFLSLAVSKDRARYIGPIIERFNAMADELTGMVKAELTVAEQPGADMQDKVRQALEKATNKKIELQVQVDPAILGGAVVRLGSLEVDGSVRSQLEAMARELAAAE